MAVVDPTVTVSAFLGERNTVDEKHLPPGALAMSKNVDIDDQGLIADREGYAQCASATSLTSAFATSDERRLFVIDSGDLKLMNANLTSHTLKSGMTTGYMKWLEVADYIFLNSGHIITKDLDVLDWRVPTPDQPIIFRVSGDLPAGQYQVTAVYLDDHGREGAASPLAVIDVIDDSAITVSPSFETGYQTLVYISDTNGQVMYLADAVPDGGAITIGETASLTSPIDRQQLDSVGMPGDIGSMAFYEGSVWVTQHVDGVSFLQRSKPYWWHLFDTHQDYLAIPGKVTCLEGTPQGLFIGTDDEMYIYTVEDSLVRLAEYGAVPGRPIARTDDGRLFVWTKQGVCSLFPFQNVTQDKLSVAPGCLSSTAIIERKGYEQFMVLTNEEGAAFNPL